MADLKTDYKDDVLDTTQNTKRKYQMIDNGDGTVSFEDVTEYIQQGDSFGADDINDTNEEVNIINDNLNKHTISNNTRVALTYGVTYTTLADGYFRVISTDPSPANYVSIMLSGIEIGRLHKPGSTDAMANTFVRKGSTISFSGSSNSSAYFYPLS